MDGNNLKKDDENGQLSDGIHSYPAAARLLFAKTGSTIARYICREQGFAERDWEFEKLF